MSALEINKLVAAALVAGLVFMVINVGVDEFWHETTSESIHYPLPESAEQEPVEEVADDMASSILGLIAGADTAAGQKVIKKCTTCHDLAKNGPDKVGPNLWGIVDSQMAARQGYKYSDAFAGLGGTGHQDVLRRPQETRRPGQHHRIPAYVERQPGSPAWGITRSPTDQVCNFQRSSPSMTRQVSTPVA